MGGVHGAGEVEALGLGAAEGAEVADVDGGFGAFGHDLQVEAAGEFHDGADDGLAFALAAQLGDERAVNFHDVEREAVQVAER